MATKSTPGVLVCLCENCVADSGSLPRQWDQDGIHVVIRTLPCTGRTDVQYLLHALEDGAHGVLVVACPEGDCTLFEGNYRAQVRVELTRKLLKEIGMNEEQVMLLHHSPNESVEELTTKLKETVKKISAIQIPVT